VQDWTTRAEEFGPRSQKMETHYKTNNGHQLALVPWFPWFLKKKINTPRRFSYQPVVVEANVSADLTTYNSTTVPSRLIGHYMCVYTTSND